LAWCENRGFQTLIPSFSSPLGPPPHSRPTTTHHSSYFTKKESSAFPFFWLLPQSIGLLSPHPPPAPHTPHTTPPFLQPHPTRRPPPRRRHSSA
jgi:hypothetical protein